MKTSPLPRVLATLWAVAWAAGCAGGPGSPRARPPTGAITRADLETGAYVDAYNAIERLRPRWLWKRGPETIQNPEPRPLVYVDGVLRGPLRELYAIRVDDIETIQLISPSDATTRWGTGHMSGVILVTTRRGRGPGRHAAEVGRHSRS